MMFERGTQMTRDSAYENTSFFELNQLAACFKCGMEINE